jgi:hypothetical protein
VDLLKSHLFFQFMTLGADHLRCVFELISNVFQVHLVRATMALIAGKGLSGSWFRHCTKTCMAIPATGPVAENIYSVTVECGVKLALNTWSICYVLSVSLPLIMI